MKAKLWRQCWRHIGEQSRPRISSAESRPWRVHMSSRLDKRTARLERPIPAGTDVARLSAGQLIAEIIANWLGRLADPNVDAALVESAATCLAFSWDDPEAPWSIAQTSAF